MNNDKYKQIRITKVEEFKNPGGNVDVYQGRNNNTVNLMFYNKENEEEMESKNLFAYELYENIDSLSEAEEKVTQRPKSSKMISKKTTSRSNQFSSNGRRKESENILSTGSNEILIRENVKTSYGDIETKEDVISQIISTEYKVDNIQANHRSRSCSTNYRLKKNSKNKTGEIVSYGERLYFKSKAQMENNQAKLKNMKKTKLDKEMKECTFKPELCNKSILLNFKSNYSGIDVYQRNTYGNKSKSRISLSKSTTYNNLIAKNKRNFNLNSEAQSVDLTKIANKSNKYNYSAKDVKSTNSDAEFRTFDTNKSKRIKTTEENIQHGQKLHHEAERLKHNRDRLSKQYYSESCPFTPKINDSSSPNVYNFFYRLQKWVDKRNEKFEIDMEKANYDEKTGKRLFSPQISKRTDFRSEYSSSNRDKFIDLYEEWKRREQRTQQLLEEKEQEKQILSNISHTSAKSRDINQDLLRKIFNKLYESLADNISNVINGSNINLNVLPEKVVTILMPLINELKEQNETLTLEEFYLACNHLYNVISFEQKQTLINWYNSFNKKITIQHDNFTFKPSINKHSEKLVSASPKFASNFYRRAIDFLKNKEDKLKIETDKKMKNSELEVCTFRPRLIVKQYKSNEASYYSADNSRIHQDELNRHIQNQMRQQMAFDNYDIRETYEENNTTE